MLLENSLKKWNSKELQFLFVSAHQLCWDLFISTLKTYGGKLLRFLENSSLELEDSLLVLEPNFSSGATKFQ